MNENPKLNNEKNILENLYKTLKNKLEKDYEDHKNLVEEEKKKRKELLDSIQVKLEDLQKNYETSAMEKFQKQKENELYFFLFKLQILS